MAGTMRRLVDLGLRTYTAWREDRTIRLGAGLAYYGLFTIIPLLALTAAFAELLFGAADMQAYFEERLTELGFTPSDEASASLTEEINKASVQSSLGLVGGVSLLFASSLLFVALADAIKEIWRAPVEAGVWESVRRRLVAFVMVLATGAVLITGFALSAISGAAESLMPGDSDVLKSLSELLTGAVSWALLATTIALLFRYMSPVTVRWPVALVTALATAVMLIIGTVAIGWLLSEFGGGSVTGAFGAVLAVLSWIYFEAQILLVGVQLSKVITLDERESGAAGQS